MPSLSPRLDALQAQAQNLIINGNFDFWQRGTTFTRTAQPAFAGYIAPDRFRHNQGGGTTSYTINRQADVPTLSESGFQSTYSLRYLNSASTSTWLVFDYFIEGSDYANIHGKPFRLQFWAKTSVAGTYGITLQNSAETRAYSTTYTISSANTWQRVTLDIVGDSSGTWLFDNGAGMKIQWVLNNGTGAVTATANNVWESTAARQPAGSFAAFGTTVGATFQLAQVMLTPGDFTSGGASNVELPFRRAGKTIGDELRLAQRYYEKSYAVDTAPGTNTAVGSHYSTGRASDVNRIDPGPYITFAVPKRNTPSIASWIEAGTSGQFTFAGFNVAPSLVANSTRGVNFYSPATLSGLTANLTYTTSGHWAADAEL